MRRFDGARAQQRLATLAVTLLLALFVGNIVTLVRNVRTRPKSSPIVSSHNLVSAATNNNHDKINSGASIYYLLERKIADVELTLPPALKRHRGGIRRFARIKVTVAELPALSGPTFETLAAQVVHTGRVYRKKRGLDTIQYIFGSTDERHVVVGTEAKKARWLLLPEAQYLAARAAQENSARQAVGQ